MTDFVIAVTGHRPDKLGGYTPNNPMQAWVKAGIETAFKAIPPTKVITGMALGVDQWAALICVKMNIPFIAAIPCQNQDKMWTSEAKEEYKRLLSLASQVVMCDDGPYEPWKMQKRNEWMVDRADMLLSVWDGTKGGTANCVKYAGKVKCPNVNIDPKDFKSSPL